MAIAVEPKNYSQQAPSVDQFPLYPSSWYPFCQINELSSKPISRRLLGRDLIAFRTKSGRVTVMEAFCSHLGANLAGGCQEDEHISCPYHGWKYHADGKCIEIPGQSEIPGFANQKTYPAVERHGFVLFFFGPKPTYEIPFFFNESPEEYKSGRPFHFIANSPWYMMGAHAFDKVHLELVHDRQLQGPLLIDYPTPLSSRAQHDSLVCGENIYDRLIRFFLGKKVHISMTPYAGTFILVTGDFNNAKSHLRGHIKSRFMLMVTPLENGKSRVDGVVFSLKTGNLFKRLLSPLTMAARRLFTLGYLAAENRTLGNHIYRAHALGPQDRDLAVYFNWLAQIHQPPKNKTLPPENLLG